MKRLLTLLATIMIVTLFTACSQGEDKDKGEKETGSPISDSKTDSKDEQQNEKEPQKAEYLNYDGMFPIVKEPIILDLVTIKPVDGGPTEDLWFWKWAKQKTNIEFNVTQIEQSAWSERKNILLASGQLPGVFFQCAFDTNDIVRYGQEEKLFMPLNGLIDEYAPNLQKVLNEYDYEKALITSLDGNIYSLFTTLYKDSTGITAFTPRAWINNKWLENLGLEQPKTLDELYNVLKAFKEQDPNQNGEQDEIPFSGAWVDGPGQERIIPLTALGFNTVGFFNLVVKDEEVILPEADPLYIEYLRYMNKLFKEGLIDKDLFTQTVVQKRAKTSQDTVGLTIDAAPFILSPDNWQDYEALNPLISQWNNKKIWPRTSTTKVGTYIITKDCKYPEAAMRFADMFFVPEIFVLYYYGPQKDSEDTMGYDGWYVKDGSMEYDYKEGANSLVQHVVRYISPRSNIVGVQYNTTDLVHITGTEIKYAEMVQRWRDSINEKVAPYQVPSFPDIYLSLDQIERRNELYVPISDYCKTMESKFISGDESLDNIDKYFKELKALEVDDYIAIYQDAYKIFKDNLK